MRVSFVMGAGREVELEDLLSAAADASNRLAASNAVVMRGIMGPLGRDQLIIAPAGIQEVAVLRPSSTRHPRYWLDAISGELSPGEMTGVGSTGGRAEEASTGRGRPRVNATNSTKPINITAVPVMLASIP